MLVNNIACDPIGPFQLKNLQQKMLDKRLGGLAK